MMVSKQNGEQNSNNMTNRPTDRPIIIIITLARMEGERIEKPYNDNDYSYG